MKPIVLAVCLVIFGFFSPARGMPPAAAAGESREFSYNWQAGDDYLYHCIFRSHSVMGIRACVSQVMPDQFGDLRERLQQFRKDHPQ